MLKHIKAKQLSVAVLTAIYSTTGVSAETEEKQKDVEVIEVSGYRGSVIKSINNKRNSQNIVDGIFAEDIGKNTDQNIADALSRVTGVSVQTEDGEGTKISVRGAGANLNNISLNGIPLTSSDTGSSVDLSAFSSDVLSSISVYKTSSADHDEGSLGANIKLNTPEPLTLKKDKRTFEAQYRYGDLSGESDRKLAATFSHKLTDDFAFLVTIADETQSIRKDQFSIGQWKEKTLKGFDSDLGIGHYENLDGSIGQDSIDVYYPSNIRYQLFENQRDRTSINSTLQWALNADSQLKLNLSWFEQSLVKDNFFIQLASASSGERGYYLSPTDVDNYDPIGYVVDSENNMLVKSLHRETTGKLGGNNDGQDSTNKVVSLNFDHFFSDTFKMNLAVGYSNTQMDYKPSIEVTTGSVFVPSEKLGVPVDQLETAGYDCSKGSCQMVVSSTPVKLAPEGSADEGNYILSGPFTPTDVYQLNINNILAQTGTTDDTTKNLYIDFDWDVDYSIFTQFEFGAKYAKRDKENFRGDINLKKAEQSAFDRNSYDPETGQYTQSIDPVNLKDVITSDILSDNMLKADGFMDGIIDYQPGYDKSFLSQFRLVDPEKAIAESYGLPFSQVVPNFDYSKSFGTEQISKALYFKANFSLLDDRLYGDFGVRYVNSEITPTGRSTVDFNTKDLFTHHELVNSGLLNSDNVSCTPYSFEKSKVNGQTVESANNTVRIDKHFGPGYNADGNYILTEGQTYTQYTYNSMTELLEPTGVVLQSGDAVPAEYSRFAGADEPKCYSDAFTLTGGSINIPETEAALRYTDNSTVGSSIRSYGSSAYSNSNLWLPSLNLNYRLDEDSIARFAISKTMARPPMDSYTAGFNFTEGEGSGIGKIKNASSYDIQPLESVNLDLSYEWYFNETGQFSATYFRKDISNYISSVITNVYVSDIRYDYERENLSLDELLLTQAETGGVPQPGVDYNGQQCMPKRTDINAINEQGTAGLFNECLTTEMTFLRNSSGVKSEGIELTYAQTYDFLPGVLAYLGANLNYTFAKTETETETLELTGEQLPSAPQAFTPRHTLNSSVFWDKDGHSLRLTYRWNSVQLVESKAAQTTVLESAGYLWQDEKGSLDFAANYKVNKNLSLRFDALNLTDENVRYFWTARSEGNPMEDSSVYDGRTYSEYRTGKMFRVSARFDF